MLKQNISESVDLLFEVFGGGMILVSFVLLLGAVNFMFVRTKGIQYLDKEFSPEKMYDDTWTYSAGSRFFDYCWAYLRGKIKTQKSEIHVWMCFNIVTQVLATLFFLYMLFFCFYKWLLEF